MSTEEGIFLEIQRKARNDAEVKRGLDAEAERVKEIWKSHSPVHDGTYAASLVIRDRPTVNGFPSKKVVATDPKARYIEFGTGVVVGHHPRKQGGNSPAFAPRAKTVAELGGDESPAGEE